MKQNLVKYMDENVKSRIDRPEQILGKTLNQPFTNTNSGARKIMFSTHSDHRLQTIANPEPPLVGTGYEIQFGKNSSSYVKVDKDYTVMAKISKFKNMGNAANYYYTIIHDYTNNVLDVLETKKYNYKTETYGYIYNTDYMDHLSEGDIIHNGDVVLKSASFDEYDNRMDGVNLLTAYIADAATTEDGIKLSVSAQEKLAVPLFHNVSIIANENDSPLNLYGNDENYKCMPYIGEDIKNGILMGLRRENKEESLFTHTASALKDIMMSDDKFTLSGTVIDVNVYCNNIKYLSESPYYTQIYEYYQEQVNFCNTVVNTVDRIVKDLGCNLSYNLEKLYYNCQELLNGKPYIKDRKFSNVLINVIVLEKKYVSVGDKLSDRYGGKGVISAIVPDELMPILEDTGERVEVINNTYTCINRENPGQLFETSITHVGSRILHFMLDYNLGMEESLEMYLHYIKQLNPELGDILQKKIDKLIEAGDYNEMQVFINSIMSDNGIMVYLKPISNSLSLTKLADLYREFPFVKQHNMLSPVISSTGQIQMVRARRPIVCGRKYFYILKQYAKDKFSATSLSSTNLKNINSRSRASKLYKQPHPKTPIRFGEMEIGDEMHLGPNYVIVDMMLSSACPKARRAVKSNYTTNDPFDVDIKLEMDSVNRNAEICAVYMKTMGLKLDFKKIPKKRYNAVTKHPIRRFEFTPIPSILKNPIFHHAKGEKVDLSYLINKKTTPAVLIKPVTHFHFDDDNKKENDSND